MEIKQLKKYTCVYCKKINETVGIVQKETRYYSVSLRTGQWEDFHGDESVESQKLFCLNCNKKISDKILDNLTY